MSRPDIIDDQTRVENFRDALELEASNQERLSLPARIHDEIISHALADLPNEACGLVAFNDDYPVRVYPGTNVLQSPTRYRMADDEVVQAIDEMDRNHWRLGAIYHSHPSSPATPSASDLDEANWPESLMLIVSFANEEPELRGFRVADNRQHIIEVKVEIVEPQPLTQSIDSVVVAIRRFVSRLLPATSGIESSPVASGAEAVDAAQPASRAIIGILGGMGPAATGDLFLKIVAETPAMIDQEHIPVVIYSDPRVPDRTEALLHNGEDPVPWLIRGARHLESLGATFIVIPCNTAHAFLDRLEQAIEIPVLSMLDTAADAILGAYPGARQVGLLATTGTIESNIYQTALNRRGIDVVVPSTDLLNNSVMPAIRAVKANRRHNAVRAQLVEAADYLEKRGAQVVLAACTEIPVVLSQEDIRLPLIDATDELAKAAVREALDRDARAAVRAKVISGGRRRVVR